MKQVGKYSLHEALCGKDVVSEPQSVTDEVFLEVQKFLAVKDNYLHKK